MRSKFVIGGVGLLCVGSVWLCSRIYQELLSAFERAGSLMDHDYSWFCGLLLNLAGYSTVLVPGFILYKYVEKYNYFDKINSNSYVYRLLYACFGSHERIAEGEPPGGPAGGKGPPGAKSKGPAELAFCCTGLMGAYLVWGLLQEKVMTQDYTVSDGAVVRFSDSQFLVFVNRLAALALAAGRLRHTRTALVAAPLHRFSYCALSNVVSAWCQYEALKYVGFPTQVLSKSCKVLPVMLMGVVVSRQKYEPYEYGTAALISLGMVLFMFGSHVNAPVWGATSASGLALLSLYMLCDSFTSSWQAALFARHGVTPLQMLVAVNLCSCLLTAASLAHRAETAVSLALLQHAGFASDVVLLSCSSALGQLLIYRTIAGFGAVVFTIIMTLRQAVSILLSCVVYGHRISAGGAAGILLVFAAVLLRLYARARSHRPPAR